MRFLLLLFIVVPIAEMWVLIEVGARIGAIPTIALVFLTAVIGLALLRQQGLDTLLRVNQRMAEGKLPAGEILEGVVLAIGGALLLTPGFITDIIGFICLLPLSRKYLVAALLRQGHIVAGYGCHGEAAGLTKTHDTRYHSNRSELEKNAGKGDTFEGEFHRDD